MGEAQVSSTSMTPDHLFHIGSITKLFTATLVLMLHEDGLLSVEDKLSTWVPDFPNGDAIPIFRLLNHTSGVYNFNTGGMPPAGCGPNETTPQQLVQIAAAHDPTFSPGTSWGYSNTNYMLLGLVIEASAKEPWHLALRKRILAPYGLSHTFVDGKEAISGDLATGYLAGTPLKPAIDGYACWWAAGSIVSTASDLIRFVSLLNTGAILPPSSLKKMRADYTVPVPVEQQAGGAPAGSTTAWGLGIIITTDGAKKYYWHGGMVAGNRSYLAYRHPDELAVAAFNNINNQEPSELGFALSAAVP